jgi:DNA-binding transcriptional ArsR family regulator
VMRLVAGGSDLLRCRFATSPLWETVNAVRAFVDPRGLPYLRPWWERVRERRPADELLAVLSRRGYVPDFLSPPPPEAAPTLEDQLAQVRTTPPERVAAELRRIDAGHSPAPRLLGPLAEDPEAARDLLADRIEEAWRSLVLPWWPRVRELVDADVEHRSRLLAAYGLGHVVAGLHERIRWAGQSILIEPAAEDAVRELDGDGLILMPSAFVWPGVTAVVDRPWPPTLVYPARGIGALLGGRPSAPAPLARLLGRTRARILADLAAPASTTALAARHGLAPSTVSAHLAALEGAGLLLRRRAGQEVRYRLSPLGRALTEGLLPGE